MRRTVHQRLGFAVAAALVFLTATIAPAQAVEFLMGPASATASGNVTTGAQTFAGAKTFTSQPVIFGNSTNCFLNVRTPNGGSGGNRFGLLLEGGQYASILSDPSASSGLRISAINLGPIVFGHNTNAGYPGHTFTETMRLATDNTLSVTGNATTGSATIKASAYGNAAKVFVERTISSAISWSMGTGGTSNLTFRNETGGTDLMGLTTSGALSIVGPITPGGVATTVKWTSGAGTPEANVTGGIGSMYTRTDGGAGTTLYIKESGAGNTGWVAK